MLFCHNNNTQVKARVHFEYLVMVFISLQFVCVYVYEHAWFFPPSVYLRGCLMAKEQLTDQETLGNQNNCWIGNRTPMHSSHLSCRLLMSLQGSFFPYLLVLVSPCICLAWALGLEALWGTDISQWLSVEHLATNTVWALFFNVQHQNTKNHNDLRGVQLNRHLKPSVKYWVNIVHLWFSTAIRGVSCIHCANNKPLLEVAG